MNMTLGDISTIAAIGSVGAGILFWALLGKLGSRFVTRAEHEETGDRLDAIEAQLRLIPSHDDFKAVNANVAGVALQVATMTERVDGVKGSLGRIEGTLKLFVEARLQWERDR